MDKKKLTGNLVLLLTALIWGSAFVAQRAGMGYVGPLTFCFIRFLLSALFLLPLACFIGYGRKKSMKEPQDAEDKRKMRQRLWIAGIVCGIVLCCGATLQQAGLVFTTAGKAGFITALYIVLVPIFGLVVKLRPQLKAWIGVFFGAIGLYFLCITESFTIQQGDFIVLIGACFWAIHLIVIDYFLPRVNNPVALSLAQSFVAAFICGIAAFLFEEVSWTAIVDCAVPLLYAGILSGGVGFTLQIVGQKYTTPTVASLLLSMESVFAAVFGFLLLGELMSIREIIGCILMFTAIVVSQLPDRKQLPEKSLKGGIGNEDL